MGTLKSWSNPADVEPHDDKGIIRIGRRVIEEGTIGAHARSLGAASLPLSARFLLDLQAFASAGAG